MDLYPRPSHADWTYLEKYGVKASSGGGRSSARETIARVAAGAIADKYLRLAYGVEIVAFVASVGPVHLFPPATAAAAEEHQPQPPAANPAFQALVASVDRAPVDRFLPVRCPDADAARRMEACIAAHRDRSDSIGGTVVCVVRNLPSALGEPCFDKLEAMLAHAMLSIPATKGFEIGSGFAGCEVPGSLHNDAFVAAPPSPSSSPPGPEQPPAGDDASIKRTLLAPRARLTTRTNFSGGIQGGISNGMPVYYRVAFKPPATIGQAQTTAAYDGLSEGVLAAKGRHDPCVVPRAVPIVEAMAALVVMDAVLAQQSRVVSRHLLPKAVPKMPVTKSAGGAEGEMAAAAENGERA